MKSRPTLNPNRAKLRWGIKVILASRIEAWYLRFVNGLAVLGLQAICVDLGLDEKDVDTVLIRGFNEGNFITELLPKLGKAFDKALGAGVYSRVDQFEHVPDGLPVFLGRQFRAVFDDTGKLREDACPRAVASVRQVCFYAYKVDKPYDERDNLRVINSFKDTEKELRAAMPGAKSPEGPLSIWIDPEGRKVPTDPQTYVAATLIQSVMAGYNPSSLVPKHGPGITANVETSRKYTQQLQAGCPVGDLGHLYWFNVNDAFERTHRFPVWETKSYFGVNQNSIAKVLLVPKDSRGPRLISAEPMERQFLQQGVKNEMVRLLQSHSFSSGHVNFDDQSINRELALESSKTRFWATLDLKDASDRVTTDLVHTLFGETLLTSHLDLVRSRYSALPGGELVNLTKYAPMGSALCFPVLATCVWGISVSAVASCCGSVERALRLVYVYGDDLVVPAEYADLVIQSLEKYLLKVNVDKSFIGARFAESCGMDAFDGVPVTPTRLRSLYCLLGSEQGLAKAMVAITAHAAELRNGGFHAASEYYYSLAEEVLGPLPYATDTSMYIGREIDRDAWSVAQTEWQDRIEKTRTGRTRNFSAWYIEPEKVNDKATDSWAHMCRTHTQWGTGTVDKWGVFTTPRRYRLERRRFKGNSFSCGVYAVPEWTRNLISGSKQVSAPYSGSSTGALVRRLSGGSRP